MPTRTKDPQTIVTGRVKQGSEGELLCLSIPLGKYFEIVVVANIPADGETEAPAYIKWKVRNGFSPRPQGAGEGEGETDDKGGKPEGEEEEHND
jgi:hypothetical protein